jgi:hypothetical protein
MSIIQGPIPVAPCQTLVSRFATFASLYSGQARLLHATRASLMRLGGTLTSRCPPPPPLQAHRMAVEAPLGCGPVETPY